MILPSLCPPVAEVHDRKEEPEVLVVGAGEVEGVLSFADVDVAAVVAGPACVDAFCYFAGCRADLKEDREGVWVVDYAELSGGGFF